ncbi:hypothetical protein EV360DRAFT_75669 [Lentinula raphanica]|nr:hypothetical protein EV360DRAFT_75669 [Lentinula raphanica]
MHYISLLLLGLISATYALPAPSPVVTHSSLTPTIKGDPSRKSQAVDSNRPADTTDVSRAQAGANPLSRLAWEYYHQDRQPYTSEAGKKLKADKKLFQKIQDWSKNLIKERTFKAVFGITLKLYKHLELPWDEFKLDPRELIFRTFGPIPSGVFLVMDKSHLRGHATTNEPEDHKLPYIEFPFDVNVDFASRANQGQIVLSFKRSDQNVRGYGNVELWIPFVEEEDRELFKECDALLFPESTSSHSSHNPSTLNSAQSSNATPTLNPSRSFNGPSTAESLTLSDHPHNSGPFPSDHNGFDDPPPPYSPYPTRY